MDRSSLTEVEVALTLEALGRARERGEKWPRGPMALAKIVERYGGNPAVAGRLRQMPARAVRSWLAVFEWCLTVDPTHASPPATPVTRGEAVGSGAQPVLDDAMKRRAEEVFAAFHDAGIGGGGGTMTDAVQVAFQLYVVDGIGSPHLVVAAACRPPGH